MKRLLPFVLALCMVFILVPARAFAAEVVASGTCGENVTWVLDEYGTLTISGAGTMDNWDDSNHALWYQYNSLIRAAVIESGVTTIGDYAFYACKILTSVEIPDSVIHIGDSAFEECSALTSVVIPDSVTNIGEYAFCYCTSLIGVEIGDSVITIGDWAFYSCDSLTGVEIGDRVTTIGDSAFFYCSSLESVKIPDSVTTIGDDAFESCYSLTGVEMGDGVATIGHRAFANCSSLTSVQIPNSVTSIGVYAFSDCSGLTGMEIPEGVTTIGDYAFCNCDSLTVVEIPASVTTIGEGTFSDCDSLTSVKIPYCVTAIGHNAFRYCSSLTGVEIPDSVTAIGEFAFHDCSSLTRAEIGDGVTTIDYGAFYDCTSLAEITFLGDAPVIANGTFHGVVATAYYPVDNTTWTKDEMQNYGGTLTWLPLGAGNHDHSYAATVTAPTCTASGYTTYTCNCGDTYISDFVDALGHSFGNWVVILEPTYEFDGEEMRTCSVCSATEIRPIDKLDSNVQYDILLDVGVGGTVTVSRQRGAQSQKVLVTVIPDQGYELYSFAVYTTGNYLDDPLFISEMEREFTIPDGDLIFEVRFVPADLPFTDVKTTDYFYDGVEWAVANSITSGVSKTNFASGANCTRGQVVTFLWRAAGCPEPAIQVNPFKDVKASDYFYKAVLWAVERGITTGMGDGKFSPNTTCTRGQVVTFLWRVAGTPEATTAKNDFSDVQPNTYYADAVLWAIENGITTGMGNGKFAPNATCTRGQIVTFLYRAFA